MTSSLSLVPSHQVAAPGDVIAVTSALSPHQVAAPGDVIAVTSALSPNAGNTIVMVVVWLVTDPQCRVGSLQSPDDICRFTLLSDLYVKCFSFSQAMLRDQKHPVLLCTYFYFTYSLFTAGLTFSALTLLVGRHEGHLACKNME